MSENQNETKANPLQEIPASVMINGGHTVTVQVRDPQADGCVREEKVKVSLVPMSKVTEYLDNIAHLPSFVAFVCGKFKKKVVDGKEVPDYDSPDTDWADSLHDDSLFALEEECRKYNDPRIDRWLKRQQQTVERVTKKGEQFKELMNTSQKR